MVSPSPRHSVSPSPRHSVLTGRDRHTVLNTRRRRLGNPLPLYPRQFVSVHALLTITYRENIFTRLIITVFQKLLSTKSVHFKKCFTLLRIFLTFLNPGHYKYPGRRSRSRRRSRRPGCVCCEGAQRARRPLCPLPPISAAQKLAATSAAALLDELLKGIVAFNYTTSTPTGSRRVGRECAARSPACGMACTSRPVRLRRPPCVVRHHARRRSSNRAESCIGSW